MKKVKEGVYCIFDITLIVGENYVNLFRGDEHIKIKKIDRIVEMLGFYFTSLGTSGWSNLSNSSGNGFDLPEQLIRFCGYDESGYGFENPIDHILRLEHVDEESALREVELFMEKQGLSFSFASFYNECFVSIIEDSDACIVKSLLKTWTDIPDEFRYAFDAVANKRGVGFKAHVWENAAQYCKKMAELSEMVGDIHVDTFNNRVWHKKGLADISNHVFVNWGVDADVKTFFVAVSFK